MRSLSSLEEVHPSAPSIVTIGNFDGFHLGHQKLAEKVQSLAQAPLISVAVTFYPHPREVLSPGLKIPRLSLWSDQLEYFSKFGFECVVRMEFSTALKNTPADEFLKKLRQATALKGLVVGHDFRLGAGRTGDAQFLKNWCEQAGIQFFQIDPVLVHGQIVSSQKIRQHLLDGQVKEANLALGRRFSLSGSVIKGDQRGRLLGFPTANLKVDEELICPKLGVYAGWAILSSKSGDEKYKAVCNIGHRPTFSPSGLSTEVHILDFQRDLYGENMRFEFVDHLRNEKKFLSIDSLKEQIEIDIARSREVLQES